MHVLNGGFSCVSLRLIDSCFITHRDFCPSDIKIVLDAAAAGPVRVDISYEAKEAGWTPKYDMRFKVAEKEVQVREKIYRWLLDLRSGY